MAAAAVEDGLRRPVPLVDVRRVLRDAAEEAGLELIAIAADDLGLGEQPRVRDEPADPAPRRLERVEGGTRASGATMYRRIMRFGCSVMISDMRSRPDQRS
jgi:hypothetical protein